MSIKSILEYNLLELAGYTFSLYQLFIVILIVLVARVLVSIVVRISTRYFNRKEIEKGRQYAFHRFAKYIIYVLALLISFDNFGISLSVIWGGAAALMVGIGLGLQQTFNDIVSGIILLLEGTVEVGDIIEVDGFIGTVKDIKIRTSRIETRDGIAILVPNSKLVGENTTNWSHNRHPNRFQVHIGVSYDSDVNLVTQTLLDAAAAHTSVLDNPTSSVHFKGFGDSALDFVLHFYCKENLKIELVKSQLRYNIWEKFKAKDIEVPFPQRDVWLRGQ